MDTFFVTIDRKALKKASSIISDCAKLYTSLQLKEQNQQSQDQQEKVPILEPLVEIGQSFKNQPDYVSTLALISFTFSPPAHAHTHSLAKKQSC